MKELRNLALIVLSSLVLLTITGCTNKNAIGADAFKSKMEDKGLLVQEATNQFSGYEYIRQVYVALEASQKYQIEFYILSNNDSAISFFNNNKRIFEESKTSTSVETSTNIGNHSKYAIETNGKYKVVSRIDNTVIYLNVDDSYKAEIKEILKEIGY